MIISCDKTNKPFNNFQCDNQIILPLITELDSRIGTASSLNDLFTISNKIFDRIEELNGNLEPVADRVHSFVMTHWNASNQSLKNVLESCRNPASFEVFSRANCILIPDVGFAYGDILHIDKALLMTDLEAEAIKKLSQFLNSRPYIKKLSFQGNEKTFSKKDLEKILKPGVFYLLLPFYFKPVICCVGSEKREIILNPELILQSTFLKSMLLVNEMKERRDHFIELPEMLAVIFELLCDTANDLNSVVIDESNVEEIAEVACFLDIDVLKKRCEDFLISNVSKVDLRGDARFNYFANVLDRSRQFNFSRLSLKCEELQSLCNLPAVRKEIKKFLALPFRMEELDKFSYKNDDNLLNQLQSLAINFISKEEWGETRKIEPSLHYLKQLVDKTNAHLKNLVEIATLLISSDLEPRTFEKARKDVNFIACVHDELKAKLLDIIPDTAFLCASLHSATLKDRPQWKISNDVGSLKKILDCYLTFVNFMLKAPKLLDVIEITINLLQPEVAQQYPAQEHMFINKNMLQSLFNQFGSDSGSDSESKDAEWL